MAITGFYATYSWQKLVASPWLIVYTYSMKRLLYQKLIHWKNYKNRKPLLLRGARQTGKTTLLLELGKNEYDHVHYFNFEMDPDLEGYFQKKLEPKNIIQLLQIHSGESISTDNHLIIFDEIQNCPRALNSLKYFSEIEPDYHIAAAGSLLGLHLSRPTSFPVGKVQIMDLYPMTFEEFLWALDENRYLDAMKQHQPDFPEPFHDHLIQRLKQFMITGGMPEVVNAFVEQGDLHRVRDLQKNILDGYQMDFAKHPGTVDPAKLNLIWQSIPQHLSRENQRFVFSALKKGARARTHEAALKWLEFTGLVLRCQCVHHPAIPLTTNMIPDIFKIYCLDTGLLGALSGLDPKMILREPSLNHSFKGPMTENFVAQHLRVYTDQDLAYWRRKNNIGEVDFLLETSSLIPVEVKSGTNPKSKSLNSYMKSYKPEFAYRLSLLNFRKEIQIKNIPLYAVHMICNPIAF